MLFSNTRSWFYHHYIQATVCICEMVLFMGKNDVLPRPSGYDFVTDTLWEVIFKKSEIKHPALFQLDYIPSGSHDDGDDHNSLGQ